MYIGDFALGSTFDLKFTSRAFATGAPTTLSGSPVISAYVDNNTTQLTAGITLSVDFDSVTGLNNIRVVATSGNGYAAGGNYQLVITTGTVGGVSVVGEVVGQFSLDARSALRPTTAGRTLDVSAGGEAGLDWANVGSPTTAVNLSGTNIDVDQVVASVSGAVGSVTGAVGSVTGNVGGNVTGTVGSVVGAVGSVTGNVGGNVTGSVGSVTGLTNATIADQVWDELLSGHVGVGSAGAALAAAGSAGDPWSTPLPGAYGGGTAGAIVGALSPTTIAAAVWAYVTAGTTTAVQMMRGFAAALVGKASGMATTTAVFRNIADSKDVITATVDADGNRSAVTLDLT